jgi:hypothetical protein
MCYSLTLVTPLTLSEVRSMLPAGVTAHALGPETQGPYRKLLRGAQTAVLLEAGRCGCRLVPSRFPPGLPDEAHLRSRYRSLGVARAAVVPALARHRRGSEDGAVPPSPRALTDLVREHARNAGSAVLILGFSADAGPGPVPTDRRSCVVPPAGSAGDDWLTEAVVTQLDP